MEAQPTTHELATIHADVQPPSDETSSATAILNGSHSAPIDALLASTETSIPDNSAAFEANSVVELNDASIKKDVLASGAPAGLSAPTEHVTSGIQPLSDFLSTEKVTNSHPTPPPEQPETSASDLVEDNMKDPFEAQQQQQQQPQDEFIMDESIIKAEPSGLPTISTDVDTLTPSVPVAGEALLNGLSQPSETPITPATTTEMQTGSAPEEPIATSSLVRPREEDLDEDGPAAKRSKVEDQDQADTLASVEEPSAAPLDVAMTDAPQQSVEPSTPVSASPGVAAYFTAPITDLQKSFLIEKTKNLKKTKHALAFLIPVDVVKLNIPNYPNIVKDPMDLATLETKLKTDQYTSPQHYANDFTQIVINSKLFNGDAHPVTVAAYNMEATFKKYMSTLPGPQETAVPKSIKRASPAAPRPQPRREARQPPPPPTPAPAPASATPAASAPAPALVAASPSSAAVQTFALQADGTPQIRRDSTTKRPHRTIKPPQSRELPYAKPKRKEHQLELKFCDHILDQVRGPGFGHINNVFLLPVDPVALNIPHYRQVVKKPMDLSTMAQKLKSGQYGTAKEFRADFELMVENCLAFNPPGNPVRDIGIEMKRGFENLWKEKEKWERNKKASERASSASDSEEEEEEEEDEDDPAATARETIAALTKQLADLQKAMDTANWPKDGKKKKKEKNGNKKGSVSVPKAKSTSKSKAPKKSKPLSYDEKQEISSAVGQMNEQQVAKLTQIITDNCEKYRNMGDDMELEIDDLPNDVQAMLLRHVRSIFGNPNRGARVASPEDAAADDDDDFAPPARDRAAGGGKRKKHKPMGKKEQQENIAELRNRLAAFNNPASGSESPTGAGYHGQSRAANDTSGDEESEESEEE